MQTKRIEESIPLEPSARDPRDKIAWVSAIPFFLIHVAALAVIWVGVTWDDVALCVGLYYLRMFAITAGYHRYFSHRAYKTSRWFQFVIAWIGSMSMQKGVLWWAAHHRAHHKYSDMPEDVHSPVQRGLWWAHLGWILSDRYKDTEFHRIQDFTKYPELVWLNRYCHVPPALAGLALLWLGGWHWFLWGGLVSSVFLWHGTFTINSLAHVWGSRRYQTTDDSRNNFWLALITCGEGWHNNHHHYQSTANQGFFWWEIDFSYYILKALAAVGIVWDLRTPPAHIVENRPLHPQPASSASGVVDTATLN